MRDAGKAFVSVADAKTQPLVRVHCFKFRSLAQYPQNPAKTYDIPTRTGGRRATSGLSARLVSTTAIAKARVVRCG
jgi:hypothetical protein